MRSMLKLREAAEILRVSPGTAYRLAREGYLPTVRVGQQLRIPVEALERLLGQRLADAEEDPAHRDVHR